MPKLKEFLKKMDGIEIYHCVQCGEPVAINEKTMYDDFCHDCFVDNLHKEEADAGTI